MASNTIVKRVHDFLKAFPPFSYLEKDRLMAIATVVQVQYYAENDVIFAEGDPTRPFTFVMQKGKVELSKKYEEGTQLIDICDEGDVFGVRAVLNQLPYLGTAVAAEDVIIYAIPKAIFNKMLADNNAAALFFASGFAAGSPIIHAEKRSNQPSKAKLHFFDNQIITRYMSTEDVLIVNPTEDVVSCAPNTPIRAAAEKMHARRVGSILITNAAQYPIGIATDSDFTRKVVAKGIPPKAPIHTIMSSPVYTIAPHSTVSEYIVKMIRHKVKHLVVTQDGTDQSPIVGIASEHDILLMHGNDPAILVKRMLKARSIEKLAKIRDRADQLIYNYLKQEVSVDFVTEIMTEINDALIYRAIKFSEERLEREGVARPNLAFCWLSLGSEGRGEQLHRTDQDNAIVYEDPKEEEEKEIARHYFLKLGEYAVEILVAAGFEPCKGNIMASNPKWNQPLSVWKTYFSDWIGLPDPTSLLNSSIFFDLRGTHGKTELADELYQYILQQIEGGRGGFLHFMARNTLRNPPPLSFFKNFIVERSGDNKDLFDIKMRSMLPLTDAARLLTLAEGFSNINNTFKRFEKLAQIIPNRAELFNEAAMAYELFIRQRAMNGFKHNNSGRFIQPKDLNKIERQTLRTAFKTVNNVQLYVKHRFGLSFQ